MHHSGIILVQLLSFRRHSKWEFKMDPYIYRTRYAYKNNYFQWKAKIIAILQECSSTLLLVLGSYRYYLLWRLSLVKAGSTKGKVLVKSSVFSLPQKQAILTTTHECQFTMINRWWLTDDDQQMMINRWWSTDDIQIW